MRIAANLPGIDQEAALAGFADYIEQGLAHFADAVYAEANAERARFQAMDAAIAAVGSVIDPTTGKQVPVRTRQIMIDFCLMRGWLYRSSIICFPRSVQAKLKENATHISAGGRFEFGAHRFWDYEWGFTNTLGNAPKGGRLHILHNALTINDRMLELVGLACGKKSQRFLNLYAAPFKASIHDYFHNFTIINRKSDQKLFSSDSPMREWWHSAAFQEESCGGLVSLADWYDALATSQQAVFNVNYELFSNAAHQWAMNVLPRPKRLAILRDASAFILAVAEAQRNLRQMPERVSQEEVEDFGAYWAQAIFWSLTILFDPDGADLRKLAPKIDALQLPCDRAQPNSAYDWVRAQTARRTGRYYEKLWTNHAPAHVLFHDTPTSASDILLNFAGIYLSQARPQLEIVAARPLTKDLSPLAVACREHFAHAR